MAKVNGYCSLNKYVLICLMIVLLISGIYFSMTDDINNYLK